ncbi:hypothetical protein VTL71DRAFT_7427 [Oculimacula yallundae]|uniref:Uncharacterized protein n=1 Tax=Oculimacula yallundae TaxID=86028 RepID=A0ABR4BU37_9HELO
MTSELPFSIVRVSAKLWHCLISLLDDFISPGITPPECVPNTSYNDNIALCYVAKWSVYMFFALFIFAFIINSMEEDTIRSRIADLERSFLGELVDMEPKEREEQFRMLFQNHRNKLQSERRKKRERSTRTTRMLSLVMSRFQGEGEADELERDSPANSIQALKEGRV